MTRLVQKFKVERNPEPFPPHEGEYFVLFPKRDIVAAQVLYVYAGMVNLSNPQLARDLKTWLDEVMTAPLQGMGPTEPKL